MENSMRPVTALLLTVCLLAQGSVLGSDLDKERRWAEQIVDALLDGEAVYLDDGHSEFLAIETESATEGDARAAVVMHGTGVHPDWPTVVLPLRVGLTETGWHTLSIQLPVLANEAEHADYLPLYPQVPARIDAAVGYLRDRGLETIVLVAHSQGAGMAAYYLSGADRPVDGFVAVGMSAGIPGGAMDNLAKLGRIQQPLLDLYGGEDLEGVLASAAARASSAQASNPDYTQQRVEGADHFFDGEEAALLDAVNAWLDARF
jgi:pimeloyl-ACP methyl ester carboxylesterase